MEDNLDQVDPECVEAYKEAAEKINAITNEQYDSWLKDIIKKGC